MRMNSRLALAVFAAFFASGAAVAGEADVVGVDIQRQGDGSYRFDVAVRHADEGWDHYADKWIVVDPGGTVLGERILVHPHVDEQPFTRSLGGVAIPAGTREVRIQARCLIDGWGADTLTVTLP